MLIIATYKTPKSCADFNVLNRECCVVIWYVPCKFCALTNNYHKVMRRYKLQKLTNTNMEGFYRASHNFDSHF